ncbi:MAG: ral nucleoside transport system ATP-binding protein [Pseudomonadota bacterium]|nr:ral nucleoside transport system ATP-binding protein [Pseudomonadota bacterium]
MLEPAPQTSPPRLELRGVTKHYPGVIANNNVDLIVYPGEIHAVLGENGAGKSTLMKVIYGLVHPDRGEIRWNGQPVRIASPAVARRLGIGMVFQHFALFESLTVAENIALALTEAPPAALLAARIRELSERYGLPLTPEQPVYQLSVGERQRVEIVRCLLQSPRLLILDEPTSVLTPQAVDHLFTTLRQLAAEGVSLLYISHKLEEIRTLCHGATVLRGGRVTGHCLPSEESADSLARLMIGDELPACRLIPHPVGRTPRLVLDGLNQPADGPFGTDLQDIQLTIHSGEIVGVAGASGNGQRELLAALSGEAPTPSLEMVRLLDEPIGHLDPAARRARGMAFVPEERLGRGAVPALSLADNALLTAARRGLVRRGLVRRSRVLRYTCDIIERFRVKCHGATAPARSLSGGNLQKFIVGREIAQEPQVMVVAQPTWGVDVSSAALVRERLMELRNRGVALLVISEDLDELFEISDRIVVLAGGRLSPARSATATDAAEIGRWMGGGFCNELGYVAA